MKKLLAIAFISCAIVNPSGIRAQKKSKQKKEEQPTTFAVPAIKSDVDSISYSLGVGMVQNGLNQYLDQMGVLINTEQIEAQYLGQINNETNETKKTELEEALKNKLDSAKAVNNKNLEEFIQGFTQAMSANKDKKAFNFGVAIAGQVSSMSENFAKELWGNDKPMNNEAFIYGFVSTLKDEKPIIENTQEVVQDALSKAQLAQQVKKEAELKAQYAETIAAGDQFMKENGAKPGVVTLPSGLQYKILVQGNGEKPTANDEVTVHYKGTLIDGTVFDSSIERGEPATFGVGQVIRGWTEALQLMPAGSKWILYIPYDLAYGDRDQGVIKPFSNLVFEVELLGIEK